MKSKNAEVAFYQAVAGLIRDVLYSPDGKPPKDWTMKQDLRIARYGLMKWAITDWEPVIRGLRLLYPSGKLTLKLISAHRSKEGWPLLNRAMAAYWDTQKRAPSKLRKLGIRLDGAA